MAFSVLVHSKGGDFCGESTPLSFGLFLIDFHFVERAPYLGIGFLSFATRINISVDILLLFPGFSFPGRQLRKSVPGCPEKTDREAGVILPLSLSQTRIRRG